MDIIEFENDFLNLKEKFQIKKFKFTKAKLTRDERILLRRKGTKLQAFKEGEASSTSEEYKHFMKVCTHDADPNTAEEHVWIKYQAMLKDENELREAHRNELISSAARDEYIKSRFVP
jgi:uncharacterized protein YifE (UPF0438 family)